MQPIDDITSRIVFEQPVDFEFMDSVDWLEFHCEVHDVVAELDLAVSRVDPGVLRLADGRALSLFELAQRCHILSRDAWRELITLHLRTMTAHLGDIIEAYSTFDVRIRLAPDTPADAETFAYLGARPFAEGVVALLAVEVANAVRCLNIDDVASLGVDVDELWASALAQTESFEHPDELHEIDLGDARFVHIFGQRPFTASMIGVVDELISGCAEIGEFGAIVALPLRHSILVHPIHDVSIEAAIAGLVPITRQLYKQGPGSVSPHLYWWRDGALTWIPTVYEDDRMIVEYYAPPELVEIISTLPS